MITNFVETKFILNPFAHSFVLQIQPLQAPKRINYLTTQFQFTNVGALTESRCKQIKVQTIYDPGNPCNT